MHEKARKAMLSLEQRALLGDHEAAKRLTEVWEELRKRLEALNDEGD